MNNYSRLHGNFETESRSNRCCMLQKDILVKCDFHWATMIWLITEKKILTG